MTSRRQPAARRRKALRPSRKERIPYAEALAEGVAEGRLTHTLYEERMTAVEKAVSFDDLDAVVADLPFDPPPRPARVEESAAPGPPGRRFVMPVVAGLLAAGAMYAMVVEGGDDPREDGTAAEAPVAQEVRPPDGWEPPSVATELDAVVPMEDTTVTAAVERAHEAGFTDIEQVSLSPDLTTVTGLIADADGGEDEAFRQILFEADDAGLLADARGNRGVYLDEDDLDIDLDALIEEAREASGAEADQDVRSVLVYRGDGSASRQHEEGNLVRVSFAEGPDVTLRASDQTALW